MTIRSDALPTQEMLINMGPQHPSTHGVLRVILRTDGEVVVNARPDVGYLHRALLDTPEVQRFEHTHVYVDVSGSMQAVMPLTYGALLPLLGYLHPEVHLFSTAVSDIRPQELRAGVVNTTWGTEIGCVTAHILEHGVRRALLITDGWVGEVPSSHRSLLEKERVRVGVIVTDFGDPGFAEELRARVHTLPPLTD